MRDVISSCFMRTTLDVDDDVLAAVKSLADSRRTTAGKVISELARKALAPPPGKPMKKRNGVPLFQFPREKGTIVTLEMINKIRDEDE
jgi:hypothetical protein